MSIKQIIRKTIAPIYWQFLNRKHKMHVEDYSINFKLRIGKNAIIRKGSEVGVNTILGDYSYISGPRSYVEDELLEICWWDWDEDKIQQNADLFYNTEEFVKHFLNDIRQK